MWLTPVSTWRSDPGLCETFVIPVIPDITHPMLSVILNRWVTVEASRSLSCVKERRDGVKWMEFGLCQGTMKAFFFCICTAYKNKQRHKKVSGKKSNVQGHFFLQTKTSLWTHRNFLLRNDDCAVFSPDCNWCEPSLVYGLKSIFWKNITERGQNIVKIKPKYYTPSKEWTYLMKHKLVFWFNVKAKAIKIYI